MQLYTQCGNHATVRPMWESRKVHMHPPVFHERERESMDEGTSLGVEQDSRVHRHGKDDKVHTRIITSIVEDQEWHQY